MDNLSYFNETMLKSSNTSNYTIKHMYVPMTMMITGMAGNLAALFVLYTLSKDIKRTVYFPLLSGLAWTDLIGQAMTSPVPLLVYSNKIKLEGDVCTFSGFTMVFFGLLTPLLVCVLSFERMLSLKFSYFYHRVITVRKAKMMVPLCWIIVFLFCCLPAVFGQYSKQFPGTWCFLKYHREKDTALSSYAIFFGFINLVLLLSMVLFNIVVVSTLLHMRRQRKINTSPSSSIKKIIPSTPTPSVLPKIKIEMEVKMVWFLCCTTLLFLTCWVPLNINILESQLTNKTQSKIDLTSVRLASINQIIDPWLYILLRGNVFRKLFTYVKSLFPNKNKNLQKTGSKNKASIARDTSQSTKAVGKETRYLSALTQDPEEGMAETLPNDSSVLMTNKPTDTKVVSNNCDNNTNYNDVNVKKCDKNQIMYTHSSGFRQLLSCNGSAFTPTRDDITMKTCSTFPSILLIDDKHNSSRVPESSKPESQIRFSGSSSM